ncbi:hypothetical protein DVV91_16965 [Clostridium botulinum]|uniref:hypothetical protein n=1 Tax=Clostridium botulinum TaxID=1491 RepID=UPI001968254F|nr:hypothetical protein [Clostridium botulinum]MBN1076014.1 hypothetical protein [Clostridium botulinum]
MNLVKTYKKNEDIIILVVGDKISAYINGKEVIFKSQNRGQNFIKRNLGYKLVDVKQEKSEIDLIIQRLENAKNKQIRSGFNTRYPKLHNELLFKIEKLKEKCSYKKINVNYNLCYCLSKFLVKNVIMDKNNLCKSR